MSYITSAIQNKISPHLNQTVLLNSAGIIAGLTICALVPDAVIAVPAAIVAVPFALLAIVFASATYHALKIVKEPRDMEKIETPSFFPAISSATISTVCSVAALYFLGYSHSPLLAGLLPMGCSLSGVTICYCSKNI